MKTTLCAIVGGTLLALSLGAVAQGTMQGDKMKGELKGQSQMMMNLDTNGDGKISKEEFTAHHEKMWMGMKKDANGMVDAKEMMKMHQEGMMMHQGMPGHRMNQQAPSEDKTTDDKAKQ